MCTGSPTQTQQASPYGGNYGGLFGGGGYNPVGGYGPMGKGGQLGLSNPMGTAFGGNRPMVPPGYYQPQQDPTAVANASPEGTVKQGTGFGAGAMSGGNMWQGGAPGSTFYDKGGAVGTTNPMTPAATTGGNMAWGAMYGGPQMRPFASPWAGGGPWSSGGRMIPAATTGGNMAWSSGGRMQPQWTTPPGGGPQPPPVPPPTYNPPPTTVPPGYNPPPTFNPPPTTQPPPAQPPTTYPPSLVSPGAGGGDFASWMAQQDAQRQQTGSSTWGDYRDVRPGESPAAYFARTGIAGYGRTTPELTQIQMRRDPRSYGGLLSGFSG